MSLQAASTQPANRDTLLAEQLHLGRQDLLHALKFPEGRGGDPLKSDAQGQTNGAE